MGVEREGKAFEAIDEAMLDQRVVQIRIHECWRTIEPYMTGFHAHLKKPVVYSFCRDIIPSLVVSSRWQTFNLEDIDAIEVTNYFFEPHVDYTGENDCMLTLYRKLKPMQPAEQVAVLTD